MGLWRWLTDPRPPTTVRPGTIRLGLVRGRRPLDLPAVQARSHIHIIGISGTGKSRFLGGLVLMLMRAGLPVTLLDPHGDLARLVLMQLVASGAYDRPDSPAFRRILYLDIPTAERAGRFLPFNVLAQAGAPHTIASNVKEAFHRAYPELAVGAPMFDTLVQDGVKVLISAGYPLTALFRLLTERDFREQLLRQETDRDIVAFFHDVFDKLSPREQADQAGAALRRAHLLTFSPALKFSLSQANLALDWRRLTDAGVSCLINLSLPDAEARRLYGCLINVFAEQAALARADQPAAGRNRLPTRHLVIDEFSQFTAQSEESLSRALSELRKFGTYLVAAHQNWSQTSERLRGALQNVGIEVAFRLGRADAEHTARLLGRVDPTAIKHIVADVAAADRTHPIYESLPEQWERHVQALQDLPPREAFIRLPDRTVHHVQTVPFPDPTVDQVKLQAVEDYYLHTLFRPRFEIEQELARRAPDPPLAGKPGGRIRRSGPVVDADGNDAVEGR